MNKVLQHMARKHLSMDMLKYTQMDQKIHKMGTGIYIPEFNKIYGYRLNHFLSVYSIKMTGIIIALRWIEEVKPLRTVICTDSMAALHSLDTGHSSREDLIIEMRHLLLQLRNLAIIIEFCWVPAFIGIRGNEEADKITKKILENK